MLVVDDGSTDWSAAQVESRMAGEARRRLFTIRAIAARGSPSATVCSGTPRAIGFCFPMPICPRPSTSFRKLLSAAQENHAAIAIGSRALDRSLIGVHQSQWRERSGIVFNRIMRLATGLPFADTQCGFKLFRRDAARRVSLQPLDGFSFDVEDLFVAHIARDPRSKSRSVGTTSRAPGWA